MSPTPAASRYRIDKFVVPAGALAEFSGAVQDTHAVLRRQPGFVRDLVLDQVSGPGEFNVVTFVEWADADALAAAVEAVRGFHRSVGFDGRLLAERLGVRGDIGIYAARA